MAPQAACSLATLITATALGPLSAWAFVAPSDTASGLGLFARQPLLPSQLIGELGGPRLPVATFLRKPARALILPQYGAKEPIFIDTGGANCPFFVRVEHAANFVGTTAGRPNARVEARSSACADPQQLQERMWLVATEPIAAGAEIRIDQRTFGSGRDACRSKKQRADDAWRNRPPRPTPPPAADEPLFVVPAHDVSANDDNANGSSADDYVWHETRPTPIPWEGPGNGDERLRLLVPHFRTVEHFGGAVATHIPGRSPAECVGRWALLRKSAAASGTGQL